MALREAIDNYYEREARRPSSRTGPSLLTALCPRLSVHAPPQEHESMLAGKSPAKAGKKKSKPSPPRPTFASPLARVIFLTGCAKTRWRRRPNWN